MNEFLKSIQKNPLGQSCLATSTNEYDTLWGSELRKLSPPRLTTAWVSIEDPLMSIAGEQYSATEVRNQTFSLQEAAATIRGNRKLTKAKVGDALASMKPNEDQTKIIAQILYILKNIQTVCFDETKKTAWTVPDFSAWSNYKTLWIDADSSRMLEPLVLGKWLADREEEGWTFEWPIAEGSFDEIKSKMRELGLTPHAKMGEKLKKEDWARALGRATAIQHLNAVEKA